MFIESFLCEVPHVFWRLGEDDCDTEYRSNFEGLKDRAICDCVEFIRKIDVGGAGDPFCIDFGKEDLCDGAQA